MTYETTTTTSEDTLSLAARLAKLLRGGETIELTSDLGGGKTTFVSGLVRALSYSGRVTSPTFTLSNIYPCVSGLEVHHYDLYRLSEGGIVGEELTEDIADPQITTVIEWAGIIDAHLPADRLIIAINVTSDTGRAFEFTSGGPVSGALIKGLSA